MTVCAAAISQSQDSPHCIIVVFDRKASMAELTAEGLVWKLQTVHRNWRAMFAGDNSSMIALLDAVRTEAANAVGDNVRSFARTCSRAYRSEREKILETEVLAEHDIQSYSEYLSLKTSDRGLYEELTQKIKKIEEKWNLLFFGFDKNSRPHIFVITEYGKIQWCDGEGVAAIGSGAWTFWAALAQHGYNRYADRGEHIWAVLTSKFAAEKAEGVGEETILTIVTPKNYAGRAVAGLKPTEIKEMREQWRNLPRIPDGVAALLNKGITDEESRGFRKVPDPLKGYIKRPKSRK